LKYNGFYLGALLVSKIFNEENKEKIEHIVEEIRFAFIETLPNSKWMDFKTRQQAQIKAKMIISR
jgi:predicted metalloendopeptidase